MQNIVAQKGSAPKKDSAEHSAPEGQCTSTQEGQCRTECPRGAVPQKWQYRAHCPRRAVPQMGSAEHSTQVASAQCPRRAERSTATEGQSEHSPRGSAGKRERENSGSVEQRVNTETVTVAKLLRLQNKQIVTE